MNNVIVIGGGAAGFFCAVNAASPNKPRQEINMAMPAKYLDKTDTRCSEA